MKKMTAILSGLLLAASVLTACGGSKTETAAETGSAESGAVVSAAAEEGVLRIANIADYQTLDVHKTTADYTIPINVFDRLFEIAPTDDGSTTIENSLVEDYTVSEDGLTYDFTLKDGILFSDGTPLKASDVAYTIKRALTHPQTVQTDIYASIEGASELMDGSATELTGLTVTDDTHFTIKLDHPYAGFIGQLATPGAAIMSESITEAAGDDFGQEPSVTIGTGPYMLTEWTRNSQIVLEANPNYWGEQPDARKVIMSIVPDPSTMSMMFQNGELDMLDGDEIDSAVFDATYRTSQYEDKIVSANRLATTYLALNEAVEPLDDVRVRKAIQMAIDRQTILDTVYSGAGSIVDGIYARGLIGFTEDNQGWLQYDPEGAKELLAEAGYADGFDLEISSDNSASSSVLLVLQIIQQNLEAVGIHVTIEPYDEASWLDYRKSGEMPSFVATWTADYNDPDNFIYTFFGSEENVVIRSLNYTDTDVINRVAQARTIIDDDERLAEYAALEAKIVKEDAAWVHLFSRSHLFVLGDRVESFTPHWAGYSAYILSSFKLAD